MNGTPVSGYHSGDSAFSGGPLVKAGGGVNPAGQVQHTGPARSRGSAPQADVDAGTGFGEDGVSVTGQAAPPPPTGDPPAQTVPPGRPGPAAPAEPVPTVLVSLGGDDSMPELMRLAEQRFPGDKHVAALQKHVAGLPDDKRQALSDRLLDVLTAPDTRAGDLAALLPPPLPALTQRDVLAIGGQAAQEERQRHVRLAGMAEQAEPGTSKRARLASIQQAANEGATIEHMTGTPVERIYYTASPQGKPVRHLVAGGRDFTIVAPADVPQDETRPFPTARYAVQQGHLPQTLLVDRSHLSDEQRQVIESLTAGQSGSPRQVRVYQPGQTPIEGTPLSTEPFKAIRKALEPHAHLLVRPDGTPKTPNVAYARVSMGGRDMLLGSVSGAFMDVHFQPDGSAVVTNNRRPRDTVSGLNGLAATTDDGNHRRNDTEMQILNQLHGLFRGNRETEATVQMATQMCTCISCRGVVQAFRELYPKVDLQVYYQQATPETRLDHAHHHQGPYH